MKKILQIGKLYYPHLGGVEGIMQQISEGLRDKFNISVLACRAKGDYKKENINGIEVIKASSIGMFWGMPISFSFFKLFKKLIKNFDILDYHYPFPLADLAIYLFKPRNKLIVHYHSDIVRQKLLDFLIRPLTLNTLRRADKIVVSSPNIIKSSPYLSKFQDKCEVVPFGLDLKKFKKEDKEKIKEIKNSYGDFVLFVGRLNYYKGVRYLIRAMKKIKANLVIIGDGPKKEDLRKETKKLNLDSRVYFLSFREKEELISFYKAAKIFVLPSIYRSEAFGIVLIEAMACGTPLISTELGTGTSYVNQDGKTGFVVHSKKPKEISFTINKILHDEKTCKQMKDNCIKRVQSLFSQEKMLQKTKEIYESFNFSRGDRN